MNSFDINQRVLNPNRPKTFAGYAFFPGTGPTLRACADCAFAAMIGRHTHCRKWQELKRSNKPGPPIDKSSESCKFFQQKGN